MKNRTYSVFSPNAGKYGPENLRIWTFNTVWFLICVRKTFQNLMFLMRHLHSLETGTILTSFSSWLQNLRKKNGWLTKLNDFSTKFRRTTCSIWSSTCIHGILSTLYIHFYGFKCDSDKVYRLLQTPVSL